MVENRANDGADAAAHLAGWAELLSGRNGVDTLSLAGGVALHSTNMPIAITVMPFGIVEIGGMPFCAWMTTLFIFASILAAAMTAFILPVLGPRVWPRV